MSLRHQTLLITAAAAAVLAASPGQAATTLAGASVTYNSFANGGPLSSLGTQTVADGTVFNDTAQGLRSLFLSSGYVIIQNTVPLAFQSAAFNGPQFEYSQGIASATIDPLYSSPDFLGTVTSDSAGFAANFQGLAPTVGSSLFAVVSGPYAPGSQTVTYNYRYPTLTSFNGGLGSAAVVPSTFFVDQPDGILVAVDASTITILNLEPLAFAGGNFNGPDLTFAGVDIAGATVDPSSAPDFLGAVSHTQHGISVDFAGLNPGLGHALVLDVSAAPFGSLAPPVSGVPEPMAWSLMIVGLGAAGGMLRRRRVREAAA